MPAPVRYWAPPPAYYCGPQWGWCVPPYWWLVCHGYARIPKTVGYPVRAQIAFRGGPFPRRPWPFETETRAAGTGLAMGRLPYPCC